MSGEAKLLVTIYGLLAVSFIAGVIETERLRHEVKTQQQTMEIIRKRLDNRYDEIFKRQNRVEKDVASLMEE